MEYHQQKKKKGKKYDPDSCRSVFIEKSDWVEM